MSKLEPHTCTFRHLTFVATPSHLVSLSSLHQRNLPSTPMGRVFVVFLLQPTGAPPFGDALLVALFLMPFITA